MKKMLPLSLAALLCVQVAFGQAPQLKPEPARPAPLAAPTINKGNAKIAGTVLDQETKKPVEFATIALIDKASGKTVDGTVTDEKGRFSLSRLAAGSYSLTISFLGYENKMVEAVTLGDKEDVSVGNVALKSSAKALGEVEVVGEKLLVEDRVDRMVYNADKDLTNTGGTATDVMKKVPGVTVDLDGNMSLRGSSNIRVLINNKPSAMMAASVADALQQIPADQIKSVEVITSPSAKYDAEGTGGIININTKKNALQGINGVVNSSYGVRIKNMNGNVGYRQGKMGVSVAAGQMWRNNPAESQRDTYYRENPNLDRLSQSMEGRREGHFQFLQVGADYELSKKSSLAAGLRVQTGQFSFNTAQVSTQFRNNAAIGGNTRLNNLEGDNMNFDLNLDYTLQLKNPGQELNILGLMSRSDRNNDNFTDVLDRAQLLALREQNLNDAYNDEKTLQVDYTHPLKNKRLLEVGAKAIGRFVESDFQLLLARPAEAPFTRQANRSDVFSYTQNVGAGYATYEFAFREKIQVKVGGRYEYTWVGGDFTSSNTSVRQDYGNFIPSVAVSRALGKDQTVKFNYTKRIQRPQLGYLNPYENRVDTFNIQVGNPALNAEITNAYELGYSTFFKNGVSVNASLFWRQTDNAIQAFLQPSAEGVNYIRYGNIGRVANYGMGLFGSTKFLKKGNLSSNVNVFYADLRSQNEVLEASNANLMFSVNLNASYVFPKGFSAQVFADYNSPRVTLQGRTVVPIGSNFAIRKEVLKKNGSISLGVDNPFYKKLKQEITFQTPNSDQTSTMYLYARQVRLSGSYKFGKVTAKGAPKRKKKINNDDAKADAEANG